MSRDETALELEKLRAEVAALSDARREAAKAPEPPAEPTTSATEEPVIDAEERSQLEELASLLEQEIRDLPTITTLAVFALGILMGRLMR